MSETTKSLKLKSLSAGRITAGLVSRLHWRAGIWPLTNLFRRKRLDTAFTDVEMVVADLKEVSAQLEERFLETATLLMELDSHGALFVKRSENLVNVATGKTSGSEIFSEAVKAVEPSLLFLNDGHLQMRSLLARLEHDGSHIAELIAGREDLQRAMAPLKYIQTAFRIEAAPLGPEVQVMFTALTQDIEKLHLQVCELFTTKYEELEHIQRTIREVIQKLEAQTTNVGADIARGKKQIDEALSQLQRDLADNQRREASIASLNGGLAGEIQRVVIGLQFQDIINQRLQHVGEALIEVREHFDGSDGSIDLLGQTCRLQARQIASVRSDLAGAEKTVKDGVQNVLSQIVEADKNCISLREFESLTTSANGMVQVLLDVFTTLQKQTGATVAGCVSACDTLRPIGSMASDLTQVVHEFSQRIHLIGLNAQVQAVQVVDGMGLEVLSARTSEISQDTNRISEGMARQLDRLVGGLTESLQSLEKLSADGSVQKNLLAERSAGCEKQLHALRDGALAALVDVFDLLNGIRKQGEMVLGAANYVAIADAALADLQHKLERLAALAVEQLGPGYCSKSDQLVAFQGGYTMASERKVHNSIASNEVADEPVEEGGVELFESTTAEQAAQPVVSESVTSIPADGDGSNVELF